MASRRQAAHGAFWGLVERASTQGISFVVVLVLARLLGPENYGLVTLAATIALLGQTMLGETFSQALIQAKTLEPAHISSLFWVLLGAGLAASLGLALAAGWLAGLFGATDLAPILRALSPLLLLTSLQAVPTALYKRELDFRAIALASTSGTLLGGVVGVGFALRGFGAWSLVVNLLVQNAVVTIMIWRRSKFRPAWHYSHPHLRALWSYGQYSFLLRIAAFTANQGPRILVGYLYGAAELGAFSLGLRIIEIMYQLLTLPATNVAVPVIARVRLEPERLKRAILAATQLAAMVSTPAFLGLALIAPLAVPVIFGAQWSQSVAIVQILSVYGIVGAGILIWGGIIAGLGRPDLNLAVTALAAVLSIGLLLLTSSWGLVGASVVFVVRGFVILPLFPLLIARLTGLGIGAQFGVLWRVVLAATVMAIAVELLIVTLHGRLTPLPLMLLALALGAGTYALALALFAHSSLRLGAATLADLLPINRLAAIGEGRAATDDKTAG